MKQASFFVAILFVILCVGTNLPSLYAQDNPNTITFDNKSGEPALVKLIGPTGQTVAVPNGQSRTVNIGAGKYYILMRYGSKPDQYSYSKGDPFTVTQTATQYSAITITLHKVIGGDYATHPISGKEFDKAIDAMKTDNIEKKEKLLSATPKEGKFSKDSTVVSFMGRIQIDKNPKSKQEEVSDIAVNGATVTFNISKDMRSIKEAIISIDKLKFNLKWRGKGSERVEIGSTNMYLSGPFPITNGSFEIVSGKIKIKGRFTSPNEARGEIHLFRDEYSSMGGMIQIDLGIWNWKAQRLSVHTSN